MIRLLIIADDFTGALDTGVKFSAAGASTKIITDVHTNFTGDGPEVLVLCVPTRHLSPREAYEAVRPVVERAAAAGIACIFKKTDSALRGNVGAELEATLDGSGQQELCFIPALPKMKRVTLDGIHYIDGVPVSQSVFGQDPFEPVTESYVPSLMALQSDVPVQVIPRDSQELRLSDEKCIYLFDCGSQEDLERQLTMLRDRGLLKVLAGCSGLAESLPAYLGLSGGYAKAYEKTTDRLLVICGSVNPISSGQLDLAEQNGIPRIHLSMERLLGEDPQCAAAFQETADQLWAAYQNSSALVVDTLSGSGDASVMEETAEWNLEEIRQRVSQRIAALLRELLDRGADARILIIGGDTLLAFLEATHCTELIPLGEPTPGVVLSLINYCGKQYEILSKSGGFGEEDLILTLLRQPGYAVSGFAGAAV